MLILALSKFGSSRFKESPPVSDMTDSPLASRQLLDLAVSAADPGGTEDAKCGAQQRSLPMGKPGSGSPGHGKECYAAALLVSVERHNWVA